MTRHFDDKSTFTLIRPPACSGIVGQIRQLFIYELPWKRSSKNVRTHSAGIIGSLLTSTVSPLIQKPQHLWDDKTHCCWSTVLWTKGNTEGGSFTSFLTLLKSFLSMGLELSGETSMLCSYKHRSDRFFSLLQFSKFGACSIHSQYLPLSPFRSLFLLINPLCHSLKHIISYSVIMENLRGLTGYVLSLVYKQEHWLTA